MFALIREQRSQLAAQAAMLQGASPEPDPEWSSYRERVHEQAEALQMAGAGPWLQESGISAKGKQNLREAVQPGAVGAYGDIELALQNAEWRREVNLSWMEFSRWGIQQIILISRLYYIKNPLIRRGVDVAATYVFGRGVEVTSSDEKANEVLRDFFERNKAVLGQGALVDQERRKYYDGNLFWVFFADKTSSGLVNIRNIDACEIQDIITNPEDSEEPWYYHRTWTQRDFNSITGAPDMVAKDAWYPALGYNPPDGPQRPPTIGTKEVMWETPVKHRKCGGVANWRFGCPIVYPALDWAKTARRFLEACATVKQSLAQIAWKFTTKGGQTALAAGKQQLETTVNAQGGNVWDTNPTAVNASVFGSGPGTTLEPMKTVGAGGDPSEVREFKILVAICLGIPPTWLGDLETSNLATAETLDGPTRLGFLEKQEAWCEDLSTICAYVLAVSQGASSGKLRESTGGKEVSIREAARHRLRNGRLAYLEGVKAKPKAGEILIRVNFPALDEDIPALIDAVVKALTLGASDGSANGIDQKEAVRMLFDLLGFEHTDDLVEEMYPEGTYEQDRTLEPEEPEPAPTDPQMVDAQKKASLAEAATRLIEAVQRMKQAP